jgi:hypothetical protein
MNTATDPRNVSTEGLKNKASEVASNVTDKAKQAAADLGKRAEDATHTVGGGMKDLAGTIREKSPREGVFGSAASSVASGLECGGQYLQEQGVGGIAEDVTNLIRRNPIPALLIGIGLGFFLARATVRR